MENIKDEFLKLSPNDQVILLSELIEATKTTIKIAPWDHNTFKEKDLLNLSKKGAMISRFSDSASKSLD